MAKTAQKIYQELWDLGVDALLDDRDLRPGVKFKDADLMGLPLRLVVGAKGLKNGEVELKPRAGGEMTMLPVAEAAARLKEMFTAGGGRMI